MKRRITFVEEEVLKKKEQIADVRRRHFYVDGDCSPIRIEVDFHSSERCFFYIYIVSFRFSLVFK